MKGLVKVTHESMADLIERVSGVIIEFKKEDYARKEMKWSWRKFKIIEWTIYSRMPFWYQHKDSLIDHLHKLKTMQYQSQKSGDEIWMSELSYCHLLKMANGDRDANPIFIMNY